jgi:hypothetical protein
MISHVRAFAVADYFDLKGLRDDILLCVRGCSRAHTARTQRLLRENGSQAGPSVYFVRMFATVEWLWLQSSSTFEELGDEYLNAVRWTFGVLLDRDDFAISRIQSLAASAAAVQRDLPGLPIIKGWRARFVHNAGELYWAENPSWTAFGRSSRLAPSTLASHTTENARLESRSRVFA